MCEPYSGRDNFIKKAALTVFVLGWIAKAQGLLLIGCQERQALEGCLPYKVYVPRWYIEIIWHFLKKYLGFQLDRGVVSGERGAR